MDISRLGVFAFLDSMEGAASAEFARSVERLGYSVLWVVEGSGRNSLSYAPWLLARTETLVVATGVASLWARAASTMAAGARTAAELSGGRFILGVGTNNHVSAAMRGLAYDRPVTYMREYLRAMKLAAYDAPAPNGEVPVLLAANNPRMLALAGSDAQGTITYFVTPEHTARAREIIGPKLCLCAVQAVMLERDAPRARAAARSYMKLYLRIPAYLKNLRTLGFDDTDFAARWQQSPYRRDRRLGQRGAVTRSDRIALRGWCDSCLCPGAQPGGRIAARRARAEGARSLCGRPVRKAAREKRMGPSLPGRPLT
jgi:probable F420-dependent oxidoreductase